MKTSKDRGGKKKGSKKIKEPGIKTQKIEARTNFDLASVDSKSTDSRENPQLVDYFESLSEIPKLVPDPEFLDSRPPPPISLYSEVTLEPRVSMDIDSEFFEIPNIPEISDLEISELFIFPKMVHFNSNSFELPVSSEEFKCPYLISKESKSSDFNNQASLEFGNL